MPCGETIPQLRPTPAMSLNGRLILAPSLTASRAASSASLTVK